MAGSSTVLSDDTLLSRIDRRLYSLEQVLSLVSGLAVFSLMILAVISVSGRNFFNVPLPGYVDWIEQAMPLIAFMGVAYTQRDGGHIRMDILVGRLKGRALWAAEFITTLAMIVLIALLIWGTFSHFQRAFDFNAPLWSRDSSMDIALPLWPAKLLAPVAFSVLLLRLCLQLWGYGRAFLSGAESPVAVPLIQSAAEQAQAEAEHVSGSPVDAPEDTQKETH
ncbi:MULTISPECIES: TRAP transporter small permease subunit [Halocynthiibacter]|uniref:TRAP transporter small permease protein n=1 Tax=Halocynthiibacter halioticoli TaxID=2986804 RepID=A0AAE3IYJ9_9RHOB|nr:MULTISPECIES: TRAP transporter small permease [Halocynthiibacter]MCV6824470.1 TRAP transporter small permease [Halocynthiibacter halioticoli]MCW4057471.1 TRAP transporter small permease [Halocynthiibacter sp. SDUM655004]MDE0589492.1 TRAP transporter small permease [Halocynthiibacter sp. C4]